MVLCFFRLCRVPHEILSSRPVKARCGQHQEEVMDFLLRISPVLMLAIRVG